jgi:hypothetical protein
MLWPRRAGGPPLVDRLRDLPGPLADGSPGLVYQRSGKWGARRVDHGGLHPGPADPVLGQPVAQGGDPDVVVANVRV